MKGYYIYKMVGSGTIKSYLTRTDEDLKRVNNILADCGTYRTIWSMKSSDDVLPYDFIVNGINTLLFDMKCPVYFELVSVKKCNCWKITPINDNFIDSYIFNMSDAFYKIIEDVFNTFEINYHYNNTRSCVFLDMR